MGQRDLAEGDRDTRAGSPVWLPRVRDESLFHFMTQRDQLNGNATRWGPMRMVFLQYPSDPIVFFESASLWRPHPGCDKEPGRAAGNPVDPVVTFVQEICDMMTATINPRGVGHVYAAAHYLDGWIAVTEPQGWTRKASPACGMAHARDL